MGTKGIVETKKIPSKGNVLCKGTKSRWKAATSEAETMMMKR